MRQRRYHRLDFDGRSNAPVVCIAIEADPKGTVEGETIAACAVAATAAGTRTSDVVNALAGRNLVFYDRAEEAVSALNGALARSGGGPLTPLRVIGLRRWIRHESGEDPGHHFDTGCDAVFGATRNAPPPPARDEHHAGELLANYRGGRGTGLPAAAKVTQQSEGRGTSR